MSEILIPNSNTNAIINNSGFANVVTAGDGNKTWWDSGDDGKEQIWGVSTPVETYSDVTNLTVNFRMKYDRDEATFDIRVRYAGTTWVTANAVTVTDDIYQNYSTSWTSLSLGNQTVFEVGFAAPASLNGAQADVHMEFFELQIDGDSSNTHPATFLKFV